MANATVNGMLTTRLTSRAFWTIIGMFGTEISAFFYIGREVVTHADLADCQTEIDMHVDQATQDTKARIKAEIPTGFVSMRTMQRNLIYTKPVGIKLIFGIL